MSCYMCGERFCDGHSPAEIESGRVHPDNTNIGDFNKTEQDQELHDRLVANSRRAIAAITNRD